MHGMHVTLFCGGPSSEHEVSIKSTQSILSAIDKTHFEVSVLYIQKDLSACVFQPKKEWWIPTDPTLYKPLSSVLAHDLKKTDLAFLAGIHGEFAEDGQLQGLLDMAGIRYSGSGRYASTLAMDKFRSALVVNALNGIVLPDTILIDIHEDSNYDDLTFPLVFKPNAMGSSVGVHIVKSSSELQKILVKARKGNEFKDALLQEYIEGAQELTCGCLQEKNGTFHKLPPVEIIPQTSSFFNYESKYEIGGAVELCPPKHVGEKISDQISDLTVQIHMLLGCQTYSRSDFLLKNNALFYIETNTLPGMTQTSLIPKEAQAVGMSFTDLISFLIDQTP